jgi:hypothetical protein
MDPVCMNEKSMPGGFRNRACMSYINRTKEENLGKAQINSSELSD